MLFFRILQHLLPDGAAWRLTVERTLRRFFDGLTSAPEAALEFIDSVHEDLRPESTRALEMWERQFGLPTSGPIVERRARLAASWRAQGGQSPRYVEDVLQAAGFPLFVHDWWIPGFSDPRIAHDPRSYTEQPLIGTYQCGAEDSFAHDRDHPPPAAHCNRFLANDPHYLVNLTLVPLAPPPVPDDTGRWPFFVYIGGAIFGDRVAIDATRRFEIEELLLSLCPEHMWIVTLIDYGTPSGLSWTLLEDPGTDWTLLEDPGAAWTTA